MALLATAVFAAAVAALAGSGSAQAASGVRYGERAAAHGTLAVTAQRHQRPTTHRVRPAARRGAGPAPARPAAAVPGAAPQAMTPVSLTTPSGPAGWITTADGARRVAALSAAQLLPSTSRSAVHVPVDDTTRYQRMDGFGAALTESSAHLLMGLTPAARTAALRSLFDPLTGAGIDLLRLPLGASDFSLSRYTYDDVPAGETDPTLSRFSLAHDDAEIIPVLREALAINPSLRVLGTPWSAPAWMKTSRSLLGGALAEDRVDVYADYLVRTVQALRAAPGPDRLPHPGQRARLQPVDYPGMTMTAAQEAALAAAVSARLTAAGIDDLQLIGYDHNWDDTTYPTRLLTDPVASRVLAGTAFHCYAGRPDAQSTVHDAAPDKGIWFTECSGGGWSTSFRTNLGWNAGMLTIGATRHWSRSLLLWNLALTPAGGPHLGGCGNCRGVLTIDPATGSVSRNVEYDILALAGRAVAPGAVRVASPTDVYGVKTVAYLNPDGTHTLTAYNSWRSNQTLVVDHGGRHVGAPLPAGSVVTLTW